MYGLCDTCWFLFYPFLQQVTRRGSFILLWYYLLSNSSTTAINCYYCFHLTAKWPSSTLSCIWIGEFFCIWPQSNFKISLVTVSETRSVDQLQMSCEHIGLVLRP